MTGAGWWWPAAPRRGRAAARSGSARVSREAWTTFLLAGCMGIMVGGRRARRGRVLQVSGMGQTALTELWQQRWADCLPVAHRLRGPYRDVWVRFHSLPESKRYAEDEHEYAIVLDRYNTVLDELFAGTDVAMVAKAAKWVPLRS
ncbi:DUF3885 domain-containing protein [Kitasatospora sp. KL5]|uniref:DUF3885 domain-containing protein n=1 Tax=Kitasatospora sp. KL5 TaxID=3425125 RepID=UPI003D6DCACD